MLSPCTVQDIAAGFTSGLTVAGVIVLGALGREPPEPLALAMASSLTWLFIRAAPNAGDNLIARAMKSHELVTTNEEKPDYRI